MEVGRNSSEPMDLRSIVFCKLEKGILDQVESTLLGEAQSAKSGWREMFLPVTVDAVADGPTASKYGIPQIGERHAEGLVCQGYMP